MKLLRFLPLALLVVLLGVFFLSPVPTYAQTDVSPYCVGTFCEQSSFLQIIFSYVVGGFGWLVGQVGFFFDYAVENFIIGFGEKYKSSNLGWTINNLWSTVRDIFNLTFIFGLIYIGFQIILGTNDSQAKRTIPYLILAALLVNFSLFITKFVVDFANIAATMIFNLFQGSTDAPVSISMGVNKLLGLSNILAVQPSNMGGAFVYLIGMIIVFLVMAYVFLAGAILITIRFVVLNMYLVFSPVMFLGWVFPGMASHTKKFWSGFLGQAFFAPAFMFMLYLSFRVIDTYNDEVTKNFASTLAVDQGSGAALGTSGSLIPFFAMTVVFLIASMVAARRMADTGSAAVMKVNGYALGKFNGALRGTGNAASYLPRVGARMGLNAAGEKMEKRLNNLQAGTGRLARFASLNVVDRAARGTTTKAKNATVGTGTTNEKERDYRDKTRARASQTTAENNRSTAVTDAEAAFENTAIQAGELNTALENLAKSISRMNNDELADLHQKGTLMKSHYAVSLSDAQLTELEKSGKVSAAEIATLKAKREAGFTSIAERGHTFSDTPPAAIRHNQADVTFMNTLKQHQRGGLAGKAMTDIGKLPIAVFTAPDMLPYVKPLMVAERMKNGIKASDVAVLRTALETHLRTVPNTTTEYMMWRKWTDDTDRGRELGLNF